MSQPATTYERRQMILDVLRQHPSVKVTDLARRLNVSEGTIRNDLSVLDEEQLLTRVRGGAVLRDDPGLDRVSAARARIGSDAIRWIGKWAAGLVENGDAILLDASTTVAYMASFLQNRENLTVVTNGIEVAQMLAANPSNTVILTGGILRSNGNAIIGSMGERILKDLHIRTAFVSCYGFAVDTGFLERNIQEAELKSHMLRVTQRRIMLVDSNKLDRVGLAAFATVDDIDYLITDDGMPSSVVEQLRRTNTQVTICGEKTVSTGEVRDEVFRIGFANLSESLPFARDVRRGIQRATEETDGVDLVVADNQLDPEVALAVADDLINRGIDLVIEYQIDEGVGNILAHKFKQANIPVIAVDIPMVGATYFGVDNFISGHKAGRALGQRVLEQWHGDYERLIVLDHPRAGTLPATRIQGQLEGFSELMGPIPPDVITYLDCGNTPEISCEVMRDILHQLPHLHRLAVCCFNDEAAIGALEAALELERTEDLLIVGQGADRRLREELRRSTPCIIGSTAFWPERYGSHLIAIALDILNGKPVPPAIYSEHVFIDAQNVDTYYPQSDDER